MLVVCLFIIECLSRGLVICTDDLLLDKFITILLGLIFLAILVSCNGCAYALRRKLMHWHNISILMHSKASKEPQALSRAPFLSTKTLMCLGVMSGFWVFVLTQESL